MSMTQRLMVVAGSVSLLLALALGVVLAVTGWSFGGGSADEFPAFVYMSPESERGYRLALEHEQLFSHLNCYCGCGVFIDDPHRSLRDCFLDAGGAFDPHASGCSLCLDIAFDGVAWQEEGKSVAEISNLVDEKYSESGPPTRS